MNKDITRQISVPAALIVTIVVNGLSNALPFNGLTAEEIADSFDVFFVPAGYAFSVWGIIYLGLIAYAVFQFLPAQRENPRLRQTGWWFVLSCAANSSWLLVWHYGYFAASVLVMLTLLVSLIVIYLRLGVGRAAVSTGERWLVHLPFSIYLGWITVATIANITAFLDTVNWSGFGIAPEIWAVIMLVVAIAVGGLRPTIVGRWPTCWFWSGPSSASGSNRRILPWSSMPPTWRPALSGSSPSWS